MSVELQRTVQGYENYISQNGKKMLVGCQFRNGRMRMIATNYIEIYIVRGYDEKIGRKYAILTTLT